MTQSQSVKGFRLDTPATYRIRVQGHLDENNSDELGGMTITTDTAVDKSPVTVLGGHLADQAALSGVLSALYDLHMSPVSVENLDEK